MKYRVIEVLDQYGDLKGYYAQCSLLGLFWFSKKCFYYDGMKPYIRPHLFSSESQAIASITENRLHRCQRKQARGRRPRVVYEDYRRNPCEEKQ